VQSEQWAEKRRTASDALRLEALAVSPIMEPQDDQYFTKWLQDKAPKALNPVYKPTRKQNRYRKHTAGNGSPETQYGSVTRRPDMASWKQCAKIK
jgi:hypothetical protein